MKRLSLAFFVLVLFSVFALPSQAEKGACVDETIKRIESILASVKAVDDTDLEDAESGNDASTDTASFVAGSDEKINVIHQIETELHAGFAGCSSTKQVEKLLTFAVGLPYRIESKVGPFNYGRFLAIIEGDALKRHLHFKKTGIVAEMGKIGSKIKGMRGSFQAKERYVQEMVGQHLHGDLGEASRLLHILDLERGKVGHRGTLLKGRMSRLEGRLGGKERIAYARTAKRYQRVREYETNLNEHFDTFQTKLGTEVHKHHLEGAERMLGQLASHDANGNMFHPASIRIKGTKGLSQAVLINMLWPGGHRQRTLELRHPITGKGTGHKKVVRYALHRPVTLQLGFTLKDVEWDRYPESQSFLAGLGFSIGHHTTLTVGYARSIDEGAHHGIYFGVTVGLKRLAGMAK